MKLCPDLLDEHAPQGVEVIQLTTEDVPSSHVYMEAQIFTPDSKRFVLHRSAHAHGSDKHDPEHRYLVCDIDDGCTLRPITEETGATAPSVSADGTYLYYIVDETTDDGGRITLKRVKMDGTDRRTLTVLDGEVPGTAFRPCLRVYPLSTIRSDGKRLAMQVGLRSPVLDHVTWGLLVFDLERSSVECIHEGADWFNMHPQYSRSLDAEASRDIMIQHNHGGERDASGKTTRLTTSRADATGTSGVTVTSAGADGRPGRSWGRIRKSRAPDIWWNVSRRPLTVTWASRPRAACATSSAARRASRAPHTSASISKADGSSATRTPTRRADASS